MRNVIITSVCVVCLSAMASSALAQSQLGAGSISGTVSDSNGAVISGATVTITNAGTAIELPAGVRAFRGRRHQFAPWREIGFLI